MPDAFSCKRRDRILRFLGGSGAARRNSPNIALQPLLSLNFISFSQLTINSGEIIEEMESPSKHDDEVQEPEGAERSEGSESFTSE